MPLQRLVLFFRDSGFPAAEETELSKLQDFVFLSITGTVLLLLSMFLVLASFATFDQLQAAAKARTQTTLLLDQSIILLSQLKDAETGQRGFLLTDDEAFLQPYLAVRDQVQGRLERLILDAPNDQARAILLGLSPLISAKLAELERLLIGKRTQPMSWVVQQVGLGAGKALMDKIRVEIEALNVNIRAEGTRREATFEAKMLSQFVVMVASSLLTLIFVALFAVLTYRDSRNRLKERLLAETRSLLEREVSSFESTRSSQAESQEYSESIINTIREPLLALDQDLRVVTVSRSFYEVFQVKPEETVGQLIYDLGNKQWDIPQLRELLETILPGKSAFDNFEVKHVFTTIGPRIMLLNARQIQRASGKQRIILLAIDDITERRKIELGLEIAHETLKTLAQELERTAKVKSEFLANMSHELRTPLNSIIGFSEVLIDQTFGKVNEKQVKYANNILTSGKHLLALINQILDMAKVESGKMTLSLAPVLLKASLNEIVMLVTDLVAKKGLEMVLDIAPDLPNIEADELRLKEILYNLLSNAVKFTHAGGKVGLRAQKSGGLVKILVWDTGIGIAMENLTKIFEGFFRVDTPYSRLTEGTGLGLPLSRKLVELHGGRLSVFSDGLGKGTAVLFSVPIVAMKVV